MLEIWEQNGRLVDKQRKLADELYDSIDEEEARDPEWQSAWTKELQSNRAVSS